MNKVTTACGCCVYAFDGQCLGPEPCPGIFIPGDVIKTASQPTSCYDVKKSEVIKAEPMIEYGISLKKTAQLMAEMFGAKPCQLASIHKGIARRLPLRCRYNTERCDGRSAAECWAWLLQHPAKID